MSGMDDEIRRAREQAQILAEEARVLSENTDERTRAAQERARKRLSASRGYCAMGM
jgi:hypothetical protein